MLAPYTFLSVSIEPQNVEPGMSNHEVETFEIRDSWFDILPFDFDFDRCDENASHLSPATYHLIQCMHQ